MKIRNFESLNTRDVKHFNSLVESRFGASFSNDILYLKNPDRKIFVISQEAASLPYDGLRVNNIGLYIAQVDRDVIRLSIEGSQLLGKTAKKNIVELTDKQINEWIRGEDVILTEDQKEGLERGFLIIKHKEDFYGSGRLDEIKLTNFVSKPRRLKTVAE